MTDPSRYYRARGFSPYYFANIVFTVAEKPGAYIRGIEEIMADLRSAWFAEPFKAYSNLHEFIRAVTESVLLEGQEDEEADLGVLAALVRRYDVPLDLTDEEVRADLGVALMEAPWWDEAVDELAEEV